MAGRITILEPTAEFEETTTVPLPGIDGLPGKVVGFVSNETWQCLPIMWQQLHQLLLDRYKASDTFKFPVPLVKPATPADLDEIARKGDAAIVGLGN